MLPFVVITLCYFYIRNVLQLQPAEYGDDRYNIHLGLNIIENFVMAGFQALSPFSSVNLYLAIQNTEWLSLILPVITVIVCSFICIYPIFTKEKRVETILLMIVIPILLFPPIITNHVSELYVYNQLPIFAILFANGISGIAKKYPKILYICIIPYVAGFVLVSCISVNSKTEMMKKNGIQADILSRKIEPHLRNTTFDTLYLVNEEVSNKTEYSIFKRTGFRVFSDGEVLFNRITGDSNFVTKVIYREDFKKIDSKNALFLRLTENNEVVKIQKSNSVGIGNM
jgi:hypothetical protein